MRYFLQLSYNGKPFCGWQRQPDQPSVQQTIEEAMSTILRAPITITGAGRTDTGVHASQMYAHFDFDSVINTTTLIYKLNSFLPPSIAIQDIFEVGNDAHTRFDATARSYQYHVHTTKNPFLENNSYYTRVALDIDAMNIAAKHLLGRQDFQCFSKVKTDVNTYFCDITTAYWEATDNGLIFNISANRFLRNMVRAIVGTLINIGQGKATPDTIKDIIKAKDRGLAGTSVPAHALFLTEVAYPSNLIKKNG